MAPVKLSVTLAQHFLADSPDASPEAPEKSLEAPSTNNPALPGEQVTLEELLAIAGDRTFYFLFLLLALPSALPVPAPGYAAPFGIVIFLLALQWMRGKHQPWLPVSWKRQGIQREQAQKLIKAGLPWLQRIETLSRPRLAWVCQPGPFHWIIGLAILLMSISMVMIIPGTNTLPAMGIFVVSFGLLDDDGAIVLGGLTLCVMGAGLTSLILLFGYEAVKLGIKTLLP